MLVLSLHHTRHHMGKLLVSRKKSKDLLVASSKVCFGRLSRDALKTVVFLSREEFFCEWKILVTVYLYLAIGRSDVSQTVLLSKNSNLNHL